MPSEPVWLELELLIRINQRVTAATGEPHQLRDRGLLESAWAKPLNRWSYENEEDVLVLAVALMLGVAQNHAFAQGNKRTAFEAGLALLQANGFVLQDDLDSAAFADEFVMLLEHELSETSFVERLRPHVFAVG